MSVGSRRQARERALSLLYEADAKGVSPSAVVADLPVEAEPFVVDMVQGVEEHLARVDKLIAAHAIGWTLDRMAVIDRTLLRMAAYELLESPDVPVGAIVSEAVELAKRFSTEDSGRFVNGILSAIAGEVRPRG
ncbi:MAG: transcription antitermination factor NusB [Actinobacteria bacterium]|nr:transcription antitermination factor NusB [Actinomycetota bacterium]MBV9253146.1 transcription antitermination factor NusB [Actinomycetota bacterium]